MKLKLGAIVLTESDGFFFEVKLKRSPSQGWSLDLLERLRGFGISSAVART